MMTPPKSPKLNMREIGRGPLIPVGQPKAALPNLAPQMNLDIPEVVMVPMIPMSNPENPSMKMLVPVQSLQQFGMN